MKVDEILEKPKPGTYAGINFSKKTLDAVVQYIKDNKIQNGQTADNMHTTLLYSRKNLPNYKPEKKYPKPMIGEFASFEVWKSRGDSPKTNILVLIYNCPELYHRHYKLLQMHGAEYDFLSYVPHITLSYDAGKIDVDKLEAYSGPIEIIGEYHEDLNEALVG